MKLLKTLPRHRPISAVLAQIVAALWLALAPASPALAWGSIGHRLVGQVADAHLMPPAAAKVSKIMGTNSLGDAANWMDAVRGKPEGKGMDSWHFQSVQACDASKVQCHANNCAGPQIEAAIATLKSGRGDTLRALRILVHLVGDIHQPLHAAENGGDRGGNLVVLKNRMCIDRQGNVVNCNLHTYWDNSMVKAAKGLRTDKDFVKELSKISVSTSGDAEAWIKESNALAESKVHSYTGFACQIGRNKVSVNAAYDKAAAAVVSEQLARAGQRLAAVLNEIYK